MNKVILMGRLTKNPDVRYTQGNEPMCIARYTLAVDRMGKKEETNADFPNCVAFGKLGEFAEKYLKKGTKIALIGRLQTGSYTDRNGNKVYTTEVIVESQEFAESKNAQSNGRQPEAKADGFMDIPDGMGEELDIDNLPFV
jgi:single-strand DNA-binding protein